MNPPLCCSRYCPTWVSALWVCAGRDEGFHPHSSVLYQGGTYRVLAKSSGVFYTLKPSPVLEEDNYFFCVCINI